MGKTNYNYLKQKGAANNGLGFKAKMATMRNSVDASAQLTNEEREIQ